MTIYVAKSNLSSTSTISCTGGKTPRFARLDQMTMRSASSMTINRTNQIAVWLQSKKIAWLPNTTYHFTMSAGFVTDAKGTASPSQTIYYTTNSAPVVTAYTPNVGGTNTKSYVTLTYDRLMFPSTGNFYIYRSGGTLLKTIAATTCSYSANNVTVRFGGIEIPGGNYYLLADATAVKDNDGLAWAGINNASTFTWTASAEPNFPDLNAALQSATTFYTKAQPWQKAQAALQSATTFYAKGQPWIHDTVVHMYSQASMYNVKAQPWIHDTVVNMYATTTSAGLGGIARYDSATLRSTSSMTTVSPLILVRSVGNWSSRSSLTCNSFEYILKFNQPRTYVSNYSNTIFATNTPLIDEIDTTATYTISLISTIGGFNLSGYDATGQVIPTWTYSGTLTNCNTALQNIKFYPTKNITSDSTISYSIAKTTGSNRWTRNGSFNITYAGAGPTLGNIYYFSSTNTWTPSVEESIYCTMDYLIAAGGGAGGSGANTYNSAAGGGGAGQVGYFTNVSISPKVYNVVVGNGGQLGNGYPDVSGHKGSDSSFDNNTYAGGLGGIGGAGGNNGGNEGGGAFNGGLGFTGGSTAAGGGGGGAGGNGFNGSISSTTATGGNGGNGLPCNITGTIVYYGIGGGGGASWDGTTGNGSGSAGLSGTTPGSGGSGGGSAALFAGTAGTGHSGIIIVKTHI